MREQNGLTGLGGTPASLKVLETDEIIRSNFTTGEFNTRDFFFWS